MLSSNSKRGILDNFFYIKHKKKTKINANADFAVGSSLLQYNEEIFEASKCWLIL